MPLSTAATNATVGFRVFQFEISISIDNFLASVRIEEPINPTLLCRVRLPDLVQTKDVLGINLTSTFEKSQFF